MKLIVVGAGIAGLTTALRAEALGHRVELFVKGALGDGCTAHAQGGIAGVYGAGDSPALHALDTLQSGNGHGDVWAITTLVEGADAAIAALIDAGVAFDRTADGAIARGLEAAHSLPRIAHAGGDATGAAISAALTARLRESQVTVHENAFAADLLVAETGVIGIRMIDGAEHAADAVVLATGGAGQLYAHTTNPAETTGDGIAMALRAGAAVADLEFVQFHPTVLYTPGARGRCPLITEAVRGEGAVLVDAAGKPVMRGVHPLEDLAPRDVVSAAIARRLASAPGGVADHVFLDATGIPDFARRFPTVLATCVAAGVDPRREPIPVAPAAHFACGGVVTDTHGRTDVTGLYAVGEVARTGLHGANRLASNSLLEGLVLGRRAAEAVAADLASGESAAAVAECDPSVPIAPVAERSSLQRLLSRYAGIGRDAEGLAVAGSALDVSTTDVPLWTSRAVEDAALTLVARALLVAAAARTESRGCHVRTDHPDRDDRGWRRSQTIRLNPSGQPVLADPILEDVA